MSGGPRQRTESEAVLRRLYQLSTREQLDVYFALRDYLGAPQEAQSEAERQLSARADALRAMGQVSEHLKLASGAAPTAQQFNTAAKELGLQWNSTAVAEAWGRWRRACQAYLGQKVPETPAQRSIRRKTSGRQRQKETYLAGLQLWLAQEPPPASTTTKDYDAFAAAYNDRIVRTGGDDLPLVTAHSLLKALGLLWPDVLACARGEADYAELAARRAADRIAVDGGPLGFVSAHTVANVLGIHRSVVTELRNKPGFPAPVVFLGEHRPVWLAKDIAAYRDGRRVPRRREGEMQHLVLTTKDLAKELGIGEDTVRSLRYRNAASLPPPDGQVGSAHFWMRDNFEKWRQARPPRRRRPDKPRT